MAWSEILTTTNTLIGLLVTVVGAGIAAITWFYRRVQAVARASTPRDRETARDVEEVKRDIEEIRDRLKQQNMRVGQIERQIETVAKQRDVAHVATLLSGLSSEVSMLKGMVDTLYRAALSQDVNR